MSLQSFARESGYLAGFSDRQYRLAAKGRNSVYPYLIVGSVVGEWTALYKFQAQGSLLQGGPAQFYRGCGQDVAFTAKCKRQWKLGIMDSIHFKRN